MIFNEKSLAEMRMEALAKEAPVMELMGMIWAVQQQIEAQMMELAAVIAAKGDE